MDERATDDHAHGLEGRVQTLARQLAQAINAGGAEEREALREVAVELLRDEVQTTDPHTVEPTAPSGGAFNPFGIGIPLFLMGAVLVFLFPPVGLLLFGVAALVLAWGMGTALLARS